MEQYYQKEIETASRDQLKAWQSERLVSTINRLYHTVPFHKDRMDGLGIHPDDIRSVDDLPKLPFTTKLDLRDTYPYGLFATPMDQVVRLHASSGTTGKQIVVGYTQKDLDLWSDVCARQLVAIGGSKHDFIHISFGYGLFTGGLGLHGGAQKLGATIIPVSSGNTMRQVTIFQDFGSTILCCTPSYALFLAETIEEMGIDPRELKLKCGIFGAEPWSEEMRHEIEGRLHLRAYDIYGLTEIIGPGVAYECSQQAGMHINEDHFIVEVIDPDTGRVLPDGEPGELVFSCVTKEAFPLLRYRTRDIAILNREPCACGRTFVRMHKLQGRTDDMLIIRGVNVFPSQIESVLVNHGYSNYQIIVDRVDNRDSIDVMVELTPQQFSDTIKNIAQSEQKLREALRSILGLSAGIKLVAPKTIERSMGKAVRTIDQRKR